MTKKTIIISAAAVVGGLMILNALKNNKRKNEFRNILIHEGMPNDMADDLARICIKYRFNHKTRDRLVAEYVATHIDDIPDNFVDDIPDNFVDEIPDETV